MSVAAFDSLRDQASQQVDGASTVVPSAAVAATTSGATLARRARGADGSAGLIDEKPFACDICGSVVLSFRRE